MAIIHFDDEVTSIEKIVEALTNAGFPLDGPPKIIK
jgi:exonuclease VII small subunit